MNIPEVIELDFETYPISERPGYPPVPVGFAIKFPGASPRRYLAWGHPTGNNYTLEEAQYTLRVAWGSPHPIVFHHAKFDLAVCYERMGLPELPWERVHDTLLLGFLCDPHARSLGLKELAADLLAWPAEERDELNEWIMAHSETLLATYPWNKSAPGQTKITKKQCGAWIFATPGDLAGRYAVGDIARTGGLFEHLWPIVQREGMGGAYDRKRKCTPIFMENERLGLRVDLERLENEIEGYGWDFEKAEDWLRRELRAPGLNFDADAEVAEVLLSRGIVPEQMWTRTKATDAHPNGQLSVSKDNLLPEYFTGPNGDAIASALGYRNRLKTCLDMFMRPWAEQARRYGGYITTNWNQTRGAEKGGTRTGRPSTERHNFLNLSKDFDGRDDQYVHPGFLDVVPLPLVRRYILPDPDQIFLHRDFDGQELRIFGHFEQGDLWTRYNVDPKLDPHKFVGSELMRVAGREIERTRVKTLNFQGLYGGGIPALQRKLRCSAAEAKQLKAFHDQALPGRKILNEEIKRVVARGDPIRTWGGRLYYVEPPGFSKKHGRHMTYEYKLINYLVQGSAADVTEEAIIAWRAAREFSRFLVTVYDEINLSSPPGDIATREMRLLREAMEANRLTVPMISSPKHGPTWGDAKRCPSEKECPLCQ